MDNDGLVEIRPGVWKERAEIEREQADLAEWRASLSDSGIHGVDGARVALQRRGHVEPTDMEVSAVLQGGGLYVDGWCPALGDRRTFSLDNVVGVTTEDGVQFGSGLEWLLHRGAIDPALADEWGIHLPSPGARR